MLHAKERIRYHSAPGRPGANRPQPGPMGRRSARSKARKGKSPGRSRGKGPEARLRPKAAARLAERFRQASLDHRAGRLAAAEAGYREVLEIAPELPGAALNYALLARATGRLGLALELAERAVASQPREAAAHATLGSLLLERERTRDALAAYRTALALDPGHVNARFNLAGALRRSGEPEAAADELRRLVERFPEDPDFRTALGGALLDSGRPREAIAAQERVLARSPEHPDALIELGLAHVDVGEFEAAGRCYRRVIDGDPDRPEVWLNYSKTRRFGPADGQEIEEAEAEAARLDARPEPGPECGDVHFALGKMYDDLGEYDRGFEHFRRGNEILADHVPFDPRGPERLTDDLEAGFGPAWFERVRGWGDPSPRPVFIVGMPRSGTTLVEQILASHPDTHGAGELIRIPNLAEGLLGAGEPGAPGSLPAALGALRREDLEAAARDYLAYVGARAGGAARTTDKLPENYRHLGLIAAMLPNARIVHVVRDPMDVCVSNYLVRFRWGHAWSYGFDSLAREHRAYERLMAHWRAVLPSPMHEQSYESLVASPESESRRLVEFCGLAWDDRCLDFHLTERSVHTASGWQVRQPIYRRSVGRWRNYERHLGPLREALGAAAGAGKEGGEAGGAGVEVEQEGGAGVGEGPRREGEAGKPGRPGAARASAPRRSDEPLPMSG